MDDYLHQLNPDYINTYQLSKDIKQWNQEYKIYGPLTCVVVPINLNTAIESIYKSKSLMSNLPTCVYQESATTYAARCSIITNHQYPYKTFSDPMEAFNYYRDIKKDSLIKLAQEYISTGQITQEVYDYVSNLEILPYPFQQV